MNEHTAQQVIAGLSFCPICSKGLECSLESRFYVYKALVCAENPLNLLGVLKNIENY